MENKETKQHDDDLFAVAAYAASAVRSFSEAQTGAAGANRKSTAAKPRPKDLCETNEHMTKKAKP